jgi:hypothetical protein
MQSPLRTLVIGYRTGFTACQRLDVRGCALAAIVASVALPSRATAQRTGEEIGVSLTILPPSTVQSAALAGARMDRDGRASIPATPATTTRSAHVLVTRPCSDRRGSVAPGHVLVLPRTAGPPGGAAQEIEHRVDVGSSSPDDTLRSVRLRVEYFVVPGT